MTEQKVFSFDWGRTDDDTAFQGVLYQLPWAEEDSVELEADTIPDLFAAAGATAERMFEK